MSVGDKVIIEKDGNRFYIENAALAAFSHVVDGFEGAATDAGFESEEELQDYFKEVKQEVRGY